MNEKTYCSNKINKVSKLKKKEEQKQKKTQTCGVTELKGMNGVYLIRNLDMLYLISTLTEGSYKVGNTVCRI